MTKQTDPQIEVNLTAPLTEAQISDFRLVLSVVSERLPAILVGGTNSAGFVVDLAFHGVIKGYNIFSIFDELAILEGASPGPSRTKKAQPFKGEYLRSLWHKHHFQARFLSQNILIEMNRNKSVERFFASRAGEWITEDLVGELVHLICTANFENRSANQRLTGEWIVYRQKAGINHYITLANHLEEDSAIAARVARYDAIDQAILGGR